MLKAPGKIEDKDRGDFSATKSGDLIPEGRKKIEKLHVENCLLQKSNNRFICGDLGFTRIILRIDKTNLNNS